MIIYKGPPVLLLLLDETVLFVCWPWTTTNHSGDEREHDPSHVSSYKSKTQTLWSSSYPQTWSHSTSLDRFMVKTDQRIGLSSLIVYNYGFGFVILINQFSCLDEHVLSLRQTLVYILNEADHLHETCMRPWRQPRFAAISNIFLCSNCDSND